MNLNKIFFPSYNSVRQKTKHTFVTYVEESSAILSQKKVESPGKEMKKDREKAAWHQGIFCKGQSLKKTKTMEIQQLSAFL